MFVKIVKDSIRKNPRAGATETHVSRGVDVSFEIEGLSTLPDFLTDEKIAVISSQTLDLGTNTVRRIGGYLLDHSKIDELLKIGASITSRNNIETYRHSPEPSYIYTYENPEVECSNCHSKVHVNDIESDYEDDEYYYEECPVCHSRNTFPELEYETIDQALRSKTS